MPLYEYNGKRPVVGKRSYIFDNAVIIGNVVLGENTYVGPGAVLRGDYGRIEVGTSSTIEDNCVMHARPGQVCRIDDHVTLGHAAIVHTAHVKDWCVIGMGAIVSDFAEVGEWCVIGEGAVVKNKTIIPPGKVAVGIPAKPVADTSDDFKKQWTEFKKLYNDLAEGQYPALLKKL
jgi:carbonic anhydrase/acetyltransferase-like protein (isoleucine patch superfamily)